VNFLHILLQFLRRAKERFEVAGLAGPAPDFALLDKTVLLADSLE